MIITTIFLQMGCADKKPLVMSLEHAQFDHNYKYNVKAKNVTFKEIPGENINHDKGNVVLQSPSKTISIPDNDIQKIEGKTINRNGSYMGKGALIGVAALGTVGALLGLAFAKGLEDLCESDCNDDNTGGYFFAALMFGGIGVGAGAIIGGGIGLSIPKHDTVEITPMVSTSKTSGTTTGGSVQFRF